MLQLQAGYVLDCVRESIEDYFEQTKVVGLLRYLSYFDVEIESTNTKLENLEVEPILSVLQNIISKGLPTRPSLFLENKILKSFSSATIDERQLVIGSIRQLLEVEDLFKYKLYRALHIVDPHLRWNSISKKEIKTWENLGSSYEESFLYEHLPNFASPLWVQLFETQRELESILRFSATAEDEIEKYLNGSIKLFNHQRLDFSVEFPYEIRNKRGFVVEIDGNQHNHSPQDIIDNDRDIATEKAKWGKAIRIKTSEWNNLANKINEIKQFEDDQYFQLLRENFEHPLCLENEGLQALHLSLVPFAVARIQKTILHLLQEGKLDFSDKEWVVGIIERDIPCGFLAFEDFEGLLLPLLELTGINKKIPKITVHVEHNKDYEYPKFISGGKIDRSIDYDLLIDISILQRSGLTVLTRNVKAKNKVLIRSTHSPKTTRIFRTSNLISYKPLGLRNNLKNCFIEDKNQVEALTKIVQNIFRITGFRTGQLEIINRALQGLSVIGLLPTGSGKSLTYQLSTLLQPGMAIVIDPIKSLMKDQYDGLLKNRIDAAVYINSSLNRKQKDIEVSKIKNAQTLFAFVSPERLQDDSFRSDLLETSRLNKHFFSYCVIDEAHCVSEWGHDFRTSYLRLGSNARNYCIAKDRDHLPFFALTATASFDVLSDIQRELGIPDESAIIRLENLDRPEIQFKIIDITTDIKVTGSEWDNKKVLGEAKQNELNHQLTKIPEYLNEYSNTKSLIENAKIAYDGKNISLPNFDAIKFFEQVGEKSNAGLIFCPHRRGHFGVLDVASNLTKKLPNLRVGTFIGSDGNKKRDDQNDINQIEFVNNKLNLLVATKAFGMGINKPNIRYVVHLNYPSSIESYYQEVGRAGRDRQLALGIILFNKQDVSISERTESVAEDGELREGRELRKASIDKEILLSFHRNTFKGIAKEKRILAELLTEIKYPNRSRLDTFTSKVFDEFGLEINLKIKENKNKTKIIYIDTSGFDQPNVGSIYLSNLRFYVAEPATENAEEIGNYLVNCLKSEKPEGVDYFNWLNNFVNDQTRVGLEVELNQSERKGGITVNIPFTNDFMEKIVSLLGKNGFEFTVRIVEEAQNFCNDGDEFIEKLEKTYKKFRNEIARIPDEIKPDLKRYFVRIRNEEDTYKAIYRLSIIGVVDDYTVNYNAKTILTSTSKKPPGYYTQKLKEYLLQYNSPEKTDEKLERLPFYKGDSEIQKCLGFLIKFVYEETAMQRKAAIESMEEACLIGLEEDGGYRFKEFIDLYMNSKYARPEYLPADTDKGQNSDFSTVVKYMDLVRTEVGEINNFKHLRGATTRLLVQRPDNFVFLLLKSFSVLLIEKENESFLNEAKNDLINGFIKVHAADNNNTYLTKQKADIFKQKINKFDWEAVETIEEIEGALYLGLHLNWLSDFNNKFSINYA